MIYENLSYRLIDSSMVAIPVYVRHVISLKGGTGGKIELTVGPKQSMGKVVRRLFVVKLGYSTLTLKKLGYSKR